MVNRTHNQAKVLIDSWFILLRYRWRFIVPFFIGTAAVLAVSLALPRKYRGEATFDRRTDMVLNEIMTRSGRNPYDDPRQTLTQELSGGPAIDSVIQAIRPYLDSRVAQGAKPLNLADLRADLSRKVLVQFDITARDHERIRVSYIGDDPVVTRLSVNLLVHNYIEQEREQIDRGLKDAQAFFLQQAQRCRTDMEALEGRKLAFEIEHVDLLPDSRQPFHTMQSNLDLHVDQLRQQKASIDAQIDAVNKAMAQTPAELTSLVQERNPELVRLEKKLEEQESRLRTLVTAQKMTTYHPEVIDAQQQIGQIRRQIAGVPMEVVTQKRTQDNPRRVDLELQLTRLTTERDGLEQQLRGSESKLDLLTGKSGDLLPARMEYRRLAREIEQLQREISFWEENLHRIQMAQTAESGNRGVQLAFVRPCPRLSRPISPDLTQVVMAALGMGVLAGAVSLLFAHRMDETFHDEEQMAQTLNLPLLGSVGELIGHQPKRVRRLRQLILYPANGIAMAAVLVALTLLLYLNLQRPDVYEKLSGHPLKLLREYFSDASNPRV
jgi:uncharacterized protein involved in exopolysaccharide biosynthesis